MSADSSPSKPDSTAGRFSYDGLDRAIHEKARLGIMTSLSAAPAGLTFNDLKELCGLTDGNLNRHLEVLREAGLVEVRKEQRQPRTTTLCRMTTAGRTRFLKYLAELERVVSDAAAAAKANAKARTSPGRLSTA
jgi:DNA-binding transcriptional ArsR family regulator